jgi:hypothetical protein
MGGSVARAGIGKPLDRLDRPERQPWSRASWSFVISPSLTLCTDVQRVLGVDGGIRRALQPYNGLANRRLQPLGHVSGVERDTCPTRPPLASAPRDLCRAVAGRGCRVQHHRLARPGRATMASSRRVRQGKSGISFFARLLSESEQILHADSQKTKASPARRAWRLDWRGRIWNWFGKSYCRMCFPGGGPAARGECLLRQRLNH